MKRIRNFFAGITTRTEETSRSKTTSINSGTQYICPMKCEGEKTYDEPGNCPVCNMKLVPLDNLNSKNKAKHDCCSANNSL